MDITLHGNTVVRITFQAIESIGKPRLDRTEQNADATHRPKSHKINKKNPFCEHITGTLKNCEHQSMRINIKVSIENLAKSKANRE